jgi:hypothetical protein
MKSSPLGFCPPAHRLSEFLFRASLVTLMSAGENLRVSVACSCSSACEDRDRPGSPRRRRHRGVPEPAKHKGRVEHASTRLYCRFPSSDTRGRPLFLPHGMGLFAGHSAPAVGTCMFEFPRFHPMEHSRLAVRTDHLLLPRIAHQLPHRFTSHHPSRLAPVTHHRVIACTTRFRVWLMHTYTTGCRKR